MLHPHEEAIARRKLRPSRSHRVRGASPTWDRVWAAAASLSVLPGVLDDPTGRWWSELIAALAAPSPSPATAAHAYGRLFSLLAAEAELGDEPLVGDAWQHHLLSRLLEDENPFSMKVERAGRQAVGPALLAQTQADLRALERCYRLGAAAIARAVARLTGVLPTSWEGFRPLSPAGTRSARHRIMRRFAETHGWDRLAGDLADYFTARGVGLFARHRAFRWIHDGDGRGHLEGVAHPDPIRLDDLVGYEMERQPAVDNTRQFVAGLPANNVLLYGDRGTGKSSTVKALLTEFHEAGLRLIEVSKEHLADYLQIVAPLRGRRERFVLFVDDLSFEEHETQYKALKAALEGSLEARPENVVLYATSNRRRLVRERFSDRKGPALDDEDDVHIEETVQEKLSLADRFGIHVPFLIPDQDRYLEIAATLVARYGITLGKEEVHRRALRWAQWHNGPSCRTARQFAEALRGELQMAASRTVRGARDPRARRR